MQTVPFLCGLGGLSAALSEGSNASAAQTQARTNAEAGHGSDVPVPHLQSQPEQTSENVAAPAEPRAMQVKEDLYGGIIIDPASLPVGAGTSHTLVNPHV